jgi:DNA-directed RNA polymerase subunit RPC12/RpoP
MLIAAATKAPDDKSHAAKLVWDNYYANHQKKGAFKNLKVVDIFMGGGTTLVEGSRLGMQMSGNDLNPVAWFVVNQELADVDLEDVKRLLVDVEADVKPQIMPFYYCDGPNGEKGIWTHKTSRKLMGADFDPLALKPEERNHYEYQGPEIIYTFWAKHGPCQMTSCGHRTPIITNAMFATKTLTVNAWPVTCENCHFEFDVEEQEVRIAPNSSLFVSPSEKPYATLGKSGYVHCPSCHHKWMSKPKSEVRKAVNLSLVLRPTWLKGASSKSDDGTSLGGSISDKILQTEIWEKKRASTLGFVEVRGEIPDHFTCPSTGEEIFSGIHSGNVPRKSKFACAECGTLQDFLSSVHASGKSAPVSEFAIQGYSSNLKGPYGGRFFGYPNPAQISAAANEWSERSLGDLSKYVPDLEIELGLETTVRTPLTKYGYKNWRDIFNARQLISLTLLLKSIDTVGEYTTATRHYVMAAFQQYIRNNNMFCIWNIQADKLEPFLSKNNLHPPTRPIENGVFSKLGRGNWISCAEGLLETLEWRANPWELVAKDSLSSDLASLAGKAKSVRVNTGDPVQTGTDIYCGSSTDLPQISSASVDLVITDPPFGDIMQYAELSGVFYGWLQPALARTHGNTLPKKIPMALEAVENKARHGDDSEDFYSRVLESCWLEAGRILKPGGILAFTFHHDKDEPWVAVLDSLFRAGFYLEATYPIRADETKGEGSTPGTFGAQKVEYDIIHVCRKRTEEPKPVSWGRMRREVMADVRQLQSMLENHAREGLPAADLQVIRRGKALEYFSRHYGKVFVDEGRPITVKDALVGINQLIDEDADKGKEPPPVNSEPITRQFLRTFGSANEMKRDQLQKFLRGSITTPDEFEQRGWCSEKSKVFTRVNPLNFARDWSGKHKRRLTSDLDQALVLIGSCYDGSGINTSDTLKNENFKPHVALKPLLEWLQRNGPDQANRNAASRAVTIYNSWAASQATKPQQGSLFEEYDL